MKYDSNIFDHQSQLSLMPCKKQQHKSCHYFYPTTLAVEINPQENLIVIKKEI
jgi:hypothetical protein